MITIAVMTLKGGTGKSTITRLLAQVLADECDVLMVDLDPHSGLTDLWITGAPHLTSLDVLNGHAKLADAVIHLGDTACTGHTLDLLAADGDLVQADRVVDPGAAYRLRKALKPIEQENRYQIALIDATPSIGPLFSSALMAAQAVLVVTEPTVLGYTTTERFVEMLDDLASMTERTFPLAGVLLNRVKGTKENSEYTSRLQELLGPDAMFGVEVRDRTIIQQCAKANVWRKDKYIDATFSHIASELLERVGRLNGTHQPRGE
jgi:chromosome partitioning protein